MNTHSSWGNWPPGAPPAGGVERPVTEAAVAAALKHPPAGGASLLPYGNGRSQGDSCLNEGGGLIDMRSLNHFLSFDSERGTIRCEAGVTLAELLSVIVPRGWFLPVTPGTKYITVGGAIANDVHGKNHETAGTFGNHVRRFKLMRSTGEVAVCSSVEHPELWQATIGGLGLTGVVLWAELELKPMPSPFIEEQVIPLARLDDFFTVPLSGFEYSVAWINCLARGKKLGRGHVLLGNHAAASREEGRMPNATFLTPRLTVPFMAPDWLINRGSVALFNSWWRQRRKLEHHVHFNQFFYPLDAVEFWNRVYGQRGFFQYQCVIPRENGAAVLRELLGRITHSQLASFLSTLKYFGDIPSLGLLSFARPGISFAVDFANNGQRTLDLFNQLDEVVHRAGGALYPAKDSRMSPAMFAASFPRLPEFRRFVDPALSSSFWRRVTASL